MCRLARRVRFRGGADSVFGGVRFGVGGDAGGLREDLWKRDGLQEVLGGGGGEGVRGKGLMRAQGRRRWLEMGFRRR